ncbi:NUDIX hydrolase [Nocardia farcinica]|uniref:NUDIX hydrolase n=2 Tax=Nocardia farcinica TaxID=37329 RepID=UPI000DFBC244|nr:NUDIX domain-containing protein [Nocardia farcinica]SUE32253.1 NTP pyrophosphohydrolases containing a Zn-finger, probably nucleic-acid-binding [Nocardia farcinica]
MSSAATETIQDAKPQRYKVTGDVHLVLRRGDTVLYGQRSNTGFEDGAWHLPAGHLEAGESVVTALVREAAEEIGVTIRPEDVQFSHFMHNSSSGGRMAIFFTVTDWHGEPENCEPDKCSALDWFALDTPPDRMIDYCRVAMKHIAEGTPFSVYGWQSYDAPVRPGGVHQLLGAGGVVECAPISVSEPRGGNSKC